MKTNSLQQRAARAIRPALLRRVAAILSFLFPTAFLAANAQSPGVDPGLIVHEWGTFTSVAGETGESVEWLPLNGQPSLPSFVEHFRGTGFKLGLGGRLRMETPVLYFYSSHDTNVDVSVSFFHGLITEWYPSASHLEPSPTTENASQFEQTSNGSITWNSVSVRPSAERNFPQENQASHYYAAREVEAAPLLVAAKTGEQREQFLFYRGVSEAAPPLSAMVLGQGRVEAMNQSDGEIPFLILFERRGDKAGFRQVSNLRAAAILDPPSLDSSPDAVGPVLASVLVSAGLYPAEAHAMLETWRDSWFEEGSRLIYVVPNSYLAKILPLSIGPRPATIQRVFLGRVELLTPATQSDIETAVGNDDNTALKRKYGRFLMPFIESMLRKNPGSPQAQALSATLSGIYAAYISENRPR